jgi:hypothetical protein
LRAHDALVGQESPDSRAAATSASRIQGGLDKDANASLGYLEHIVLLIRYLLPIESVYINVHGGYFDGETTRAIIYRLACIL